MLPEAGVDMAFAAKVTGGPPRFDILEPILQRPSPTEGEDDDAVGFINGYIT